ncbi:MAG: sigma-70 family RNA polymerase sigma factor [Thermoanaerobaculia bacterium]
MTERENALVRALRAGEPSAFETLVREYGPRLLRLARRFLENEEDARDAVQDAFIAVYRAAKSFEANSALTTWLHRILVNAALMKLRTKRRHPEEDIESLLPRFAEDGHQVEPSTPWPESAQTMLEREEERALVRGAIAQLPDAYRTVLLLRDIEEMSTEETAAILGTTKNVAKIRLHRARQALRALLDREMKAKKT